MSMSFKASPDGTFGEILVNGQAVAKLPITGNAVIPGLVGTVSQSGGVPTGAVVERGSNANGEYVRFADGTQICFISQTSTDTGPSVWTYAGSFVGVPAVLVSQNNDTAGSATFQDVSGSQVFFNGWKYDGTRLVRSIGMLACGRWF